MVLMANTVNHNYFEVPQKPTQYPIVDCWSSVLDLMLVHHPSHMPICLSKSSPKKTIPIQSSIPSYLRFHPKNGSIHHPVSSICIDRLKDLFADQNSGPEIGPAWHATVGIIRLQGLQLAKVGTLAGHGADFNWAVGRTTWAC